MSRKQMKHMDLDEDEDYKNVNKKKKSKKKKSKVKRILFTIFIIILMLIAVFFGVIIGYGYNMLTTIESDTSFNKNDIEVNEGIQTTGYKNIVLYGVDARSQKNSYEGSLSDVIMIVSINQDTKKVKIASVYRDTYLQNPKNKTFDKITHAFGEGGPALSMSILNTNLDLDLKDYVAVNFNVVVDVVDAVRRNYNGYNIRRSKLYKSIYRRSK